MARDLLSELHSDREKRRHFIDICETLAKLADPEVFNSKDGGHGPDPHGSLRNYFYSHVTMLREIIEEVR